ncbi:MAG: Rossmann-like and DUF2520 domain-containing protein [bacterium]
MPRVVRKQYQKSAVTVIGSGRLGTALARALALSGYPIEAVVVRHSSNAGRSARLVGSNTKGLSASELHLLSRTNITIIATPDGEIAGVARRLAELQKDVAKGRTVLHTSGALSSDSVLSPLAVVGFHVGSLHPLVSVSDPRTGAENLRGAFYCVEGDPVARSIARAIVQDLGGHSFEIDSTSKPLYHAAAVMASGHLVALFQLATEMLEVCGLTPKIARRVLLPLVESTVKNLSTTEPAQALTGTFARGDLATVKKHLQALSTNDLDQALAVYKVLGDRSLELARANGVNPRLLKRIGQTLQASAKQRPAKTKG